MPGWIVFPLLLAGVCGSYLVWEQARPEAREERSRENIQERVDRAIALVSPTSRQAAIESGLTGIPKGEDPRAKMLDDAIWFGDSAAVAKLLSTMSPKDRAARMGMIPGCFSRGDVRMVRTLLDNGVPAQVIDEKHPPEFAKVTLRRGSSTSPLAGAIIHRSVDGARLLLRYGADPDRKVRLSSNDVAWIVRGARVMERVEGDRWAKIPMSRRIEEARRPQKLSTYTIRQLALLTDDQALRTVFQRSPRSTVATRSAMRTSE